MHTICRLGLVLTTLVAAAACASKLKPTTDEVMEDASVDDDVESDLPKRSGKFTHAPKRDGSVVTNVDATVENEWQRLDLDTGLSTDDEHDWDVSFSRFFIVTNGGVAGPGGVYVAALHEQSFDALTIAPNEGFAADREDTEEDGDANPDNVFNSGPEDWYNYNVNKHELSPKDITYVIASSEERFYKFRIEKYYDSAGTPAKMQVRWAEITAPESGWPPPEDDAAAPGGE